MSSNKDTSKSQERSNHSHSLSKDKKKYPSSVRHSVNFTNIAGSLGKEGFDKENPSSLSSSGASLSETLLEQSLSSSPMSTPPSIVSSSSSSTSSIYDSPSILSPLSFSSSSSGYSSDEDGASASYSVDYPNLYDGTSDADLKVPGDMTPMSPKVGSVSGRSSNPLLNEPPLYTGGERSFDSVVSWLVLKNADPDLQASFLFTFKLASNNDEMIRSLEDLAARITQGTAVKTKAQQVEKLFAFLTTWVQCGLERGILHKVLTVAQAVLSTDHINRLKLMAVKETGLLRPGSGESSPPASPAQGTPTSRGPNWRATLSSAHFGGDRGGFQFGSTPSTLIAYQLTLIQFNLVTKVGGQEFLKQAWQAPNKDVVAPNLTVVCNRFNQVSYWAATEIILGPNPKAQAKIMEKLIKVAEKLYAINNFDTMMQIIAGIENIAVQRLKKVLARLPVKSKESLRRLEDAMAPQNNFQLYRESLRALSVHVPRLPYIPYMPIILKDITFINDGNSDNVDGTINFEKLFRLGGQIVNFMKVKDTPYELKYEDGLNKALLNLKCLPEKRLMEYSLLAEPNEALSELVKSDDSAEANTIASSPSSGHGSSKLASPRRLLTSKELNAQNTSPRDHFQPSRRPSFTRFPKDLLPENGENSPSISPSSSPTALSSSPLSQSSSATQSPSSFPVSPLTMSLPTSPACPSTPQFLSYLHARHNSAPEPYRGQGEKGHDGHI